MTESESISHTISFTDRLKHAWNIFKIKEETSPAQSTSYGTSYMYGSSVRPDRARLHISNERSIIASLYNRIATDVAAIPIKHVRLNDNDRFVEVIESGLNNCLSVEANIDQTGREFIFDAVISMFDEGKVALVPVETSIDLRRTDAYDILSMRTAKIIEWFPQEVKVEVYDERTMQKKELVLPKSKVAIVENPFYTVMNEPNSTLKRLIRKLNLLDYIDEQSGSSKLDMIIKLPYAIRTDARREQADNRKKQIESQLKDSKYGIAYIDPSEEIIQLNRSVENNLMSQIEYLTKMLYSQLGVTESVFDGTADEKTMLNYYNCTIEPILSALTNEMLRKFLTKTARTQNQSITFIRDPFRLVPVNEMAEIADKFTRNEILSSNEIRSVVGYRPSDDARADELRNKNLNSSEDQMLDPEADELDGLEDLDPEDLEDLEGELDEI